MYIFCPVTLHYIPVLLLLFFQVLLLFFQVSLLLLLVVVFFFFYHLSVCSQPRLTPQSSCGLLETLVASRPSKAIPTLFSKPFSCPEACRLHLGKGWVDGAENIVVVFFVFFNFIFVMYSCLIYI